ncbi:MAG: tRNA (adenosine(37)-N6)-threonylcarbamoyltransferase complex ATPase subunit type 1 TsaE [Porphyromonas sp.]|nr:tRNA (adenosine(37)-N6)-threonylcarbamoyltransferase complex ATPase subunit type 1 TsaE [Bacteroidales bacterium]MDD7559718.1 tRNA (adenosine(37)-N6)-threonylcarbamoyltransferase complex ATPase subunit type 1 TsaE [Bacteroidales bacterium]MDY3100202.1 tRNA (adenosine(37)-N6)-threonylcarbamoyltransferase complex ATPase subunit type 1 TsaE [Porphyromonas sp.]
MVQQPFSISYRLDDLGDVAQMLLDRLGEDPVWVFDAPMGAGKTTLINELCRLLGVEEITNSPTFSLVNEYSTEGHGIIFHIDCYRLDNLAEGYRIGLNEYLESDNYCFVEWPAVVADMLPEDAVRLQIDPDPSDPGLRTLTYLGARYAGSFKYTVKEDE